MQNVEVEALHARPLVLCERFCGKQRPGVEKRHLAQLPRVFRAEPVLKALAELQHRAGSALKAQRTEKLRRVGKEVRGRFGVVGNPEGLVPLFENDGVPDDDGCKQNKQQARDEDDPEQRLFEKSGSLAALGGIIFGIVGLGVVLLQFLTFCDAKAVAGSLFSCAHGLHAAFGLLGGEVFESRR